MRKLREWIALAVGRLLRVPVEIDPVWYGAEPVLRGAAFDRALREFFDASPPKRPELRVIEGGNNLRAKEQTE